MQKAVETIEVTMDAGRRTFDNSFPYLELLIGSEVCYVVDVHRRNREPYYGCRVP